MHTQFTHHIYFSILSVLFSWGLFVFVVTVVRETVLYGSGESLFHLFTGL